MTHIKVCFSLVLAKDWEQLECLPVTRELLLDGAPPQGGELGERGGKFCVDLAKSQVWGKGRVTTAR